MTTDYEDPAVTIWREVVTEFGLQHIEDHFPECDPQAAAEAHIEACDNAEFEDRDEESPAIGPYCGCLTCVVREVLYAGFKAVLEHRRHASDPIRDALQREFDFGLPAENSTENLYGYGITRLPLDPK